MKIIVTENYAASCKKAADIIIQQIKDKADSKLGLATGGTAENVYPYLVDAYKAGEVSFAKIRTVNLDEYIGMDPSHEQSYKNYMNKRLFSLVDIDEKNTYVPSGKNNIEDEIALFNSKLYDDGLIDIQLLGIGVSGHIGFNEPAENLTAGVHIEQLDESTIQANSRFFENADQVPRQSITMGVGDIMKAGKIVLLATGEQKIPAMKALLMDDYVNGKVPATVLKLHRDATIIIDKALADGVGYKY